VSGSRIDELSRRLAQDPGSRLFARLAEEHRQAGELAEAVRIARSGLVAHPVYPAARLTLGRALLSSGDARAALGELEAALRQAPGSILASRFLAEALEAVGDLQGALRQYATTLSLAPGDREIEARLGALRTRLEALPPAAEPATSAAGGSGAPVRGPSEREADADDGAPSPTATPFSSPTLAELYLRQGFLERAIGVYRQVVAEKPGNERALARLGEIEALARQREGAQADGRRRMLERTIGCLEALLGAARRR
jgi:tetratricopeptide (TPR) repeat protein